MAFEKQQITPVGRLRRRWPQPLCAVIMNTELNFKQIHSECGWHETAVKESNICGCFYCITTFPPSEIEEWIDEPEDCPRGPGRTAICPKCGIDAVLPESELYAITNELLEAMNKEWF